MIRRSYRNAAFRIDHLDSGAQSHSHASHTAIGADDHHAQSHTVGSHTGFPGGGTTFLRDDGTFAAPPGGASLPAGVIVMWSGLLANIPAGWGLCDGSPGRPDLRGMFIKGSAAGVDPGVTGGAATHNHPAHVVTQPNNHNAHVVTQPNNHVVTQPSNHASHNHTYTQVVNHVHVQSVNSASTGGLSGYTADTSTNTPAVSGYSTQNPTGGVATGTTNNESATLTHAGTAVDAHAGTNVDAHSAHTGTAVDAHTAQSNEPAFYSLAFIIKL